MAVDGQGNLYVSTNNGSITEVSIAGAIVATGQIPTPMDATYPPEAANLTPGPDGNIWFTETYPRNSSGNFIVIATDSIGKMTPAGTISQYPVPTQYAGIGSTNTTVGTYITAGGDGNVWFVEYEAGNVAKITPSGVVTEYPLAGDAFIPSGLALGGDGNIWVRAATTNKIWRVTPNGTATTFTTPTTNTGSDVELVLGPDRALWYPEDEKIGRINTAGSVVEFPLPTQTVNNGPNFSFQLAFSPEGLGTVLEYTSSDAVAFKIAIANAHDFNGDGYSDIFWRDTSGNLAIWQMQGSTITNPNSAGLGGVATTWSIVGQHDFNGDGDADLLWHDTAGNLAIWEMNGTTILNANSAGLGAVSTVWTVAGVGDFNGDGMADVLWRNTTTGDVAIWEMNGTTILNPNAAGVGNVATNWSVVGVGDFNGDGSADILWKNNTNGNLAIYLMSGTTITSSATFANPGAYSVVGIGDFNGDGMSDILLRDTSGDIAIWQMNGTTITNANTSGVGNLATAWSVSNVGDFNGNGMSDILWRDTSGDIAIWYMNGTTLSSGAGLGAIPTTFTIQGTNAD
jgi:hypothetical protein